MYLQLNVSEETARQLRQQLHDQRELGEELEFRLCELEQCSEMVRDFVVVAKSYNGLEMACVFNLDIALNWCSYAL